MGHDVQPGTLEVDNIGSDVWLITMSGEHDLGTADALRARFDDVMDSGTRVVVDLTGAAFIDSAILSVLIGGHRRANEKNDPFVMVAPPGGHARRLLEICGLVGLIDTFSSRDEALRAVAAPPDASPPSAGVETR